LLSLPRSPAEPGAGGWWLVSSFRCDDVSSRTARLLALLLVLFGSVATHADEPVVIGRTATMHSAVLDENRTFHVFLPQSCDWAKDRRYAVLYLLDGETHARHTAAPVEPHSSARRSPSPWRTASIAPSRRPARESSQAANSAHTSPA
jgi:hypothetical protein